jgi:hypothetical protein
MDMSDPPTHEGVQPRTLPGREKINWGVVVSFLLAGVGSLAIGFEISYGWTVFRNEHAAYWSGLCVNVGTTLILAAVLVWFEKVLLKKVRDENGAAVAQAAQAAATNAAEVTLERLAPRLDEIEDELRLRAASRAAERVASAKEVAETPTFDGVEDAFLDAASINAIHRRAYPGTDDEVRSIVVPAGDALSSPRIQVEFAPATSVRSARLVLTHLPSSLREPTTVVWLPDNDILEALATLKDGMVANGERDAAASFSATMLFTNISSLLGDAVAARQGDGAAWLSGRPVIEMVRDGWIATEGGIEVRGHGTVAHRKMFGSYALGSNRIVNQRVSREPPDGLHAETWRVSVERAGRYYRGVAFPHLLERQPPPSWLDPDS